MSSKFCAFNNQRVCDFTCAWYMSDEIDKALDCAFLEMLLDIKETLDHIAYEKQ